MTPQEIMDLRGYGSAENQLRKAGMWRVCINDTERIDWMESKSVTVMSIDREYNLVDDAVGEYWGGGIRWHLDAAADAEIMNIEETQ